MPNARLLSMFLTLGALLANVSCGSLFSTCHMCPPVPKPQHFVYTANSGGTQSTVSALSASPSIGALTAIQGSPFAAGSGAIALAADPTKGRIYTANSLSGDISGFSINPNTGVISGITGSPFSAESGVNAIVTEPAGAFAYAISGRSANLWSFSIDASGALTPLSTPLVIANSATESSSLVFDPSGRYLYVTSDDSVSTSLYGFSRNSASGVLTPISSFPVAIAGLANKSAFDPTGKFLIVTGTNVFGTNGGVEVFSLNSSTGALSLATPPIQVGNDPAGIALDSSGKYVYIPNTGDVSVSAFTLNNSTGALTTITGSPFASGGKGNINGPLGIAASSVGPFIYVCNASNDVSAFSINTTTGALTPISGSPFSDGGNAPSAIVFVP